MSPIFLVPPSGAVHIPKGWVLGPQLPRDPRNEFTFLLVCPPDLLRAFKGEPSSFFGLSPCPPPPPHPRVCSITHLSVPPCPHKSRAAKELSRKQSLGQALALVLEAAAGRSEQGVLPRPVCFPPPAAYRGLYLPGWELAVKGRARNASGT